MYDSVLAFAHALTSLHEAGTINKVTALRSAKIFNKVPPPDFLNDTVISYELVLKCVHSDARNMSKEKFLWLYEQNCLGCFAWVSAGSLPIFFCLKDLFDREDYRKPVSDWMLLCLRCHLPATGLFPLDLTVWPTPYQLTLDLSVFIARRSSKWSNCSAQKNERCKHRIWKFHWWQNVLRFSSRCARCLRCGEFKRRHVDQCRILRPLPRSRAQVKEQDRVAWGELAGAIR